MSEPMQWLITCPDSPLAAALGSLHVALVEIIRAEERLGWNGKIEVAEEHCEALRFCSIQLSKVWLGLIETRLSEGTAEDRTTPWIFVQHAEGFWENHADLCGGLQRASKTRQQAGLVEAFTVAVEKAKATLQHFLGIWRLDPDVHQDSNHHSEFKDGSSACGSQTLASSPLTTDSDD